MQPAAEDHLEDARGRDLDRSDTALEPCDAAISSGAPPHRVDAAHEDQQSTAHFVGRSPEPLHPGATDSPVGQSSVVEPPIAPVVPIERLQHHAEQLAECLRRRQEALDRREAEWHAQVARWEQELRTARLEIAQQREELQSWHRQLQQQREELQQMATAMAAAEAACEHKFQSAQKSWQERQHALDARELRLLGREQAVAEREAACQQAQQRLRLAEQHLEARCRFAEQQIVHRAAELQRLHRLLLDQLMRHLDCHTAQAAQEACAQETAAREHLDTAIHQVQIRLSHIAALEQQLLRQREELQRQQEQLRLAERHFASARQLWLEQQAERERLWREKSHAWEQRIEQQWQRLNRRAAQLAQSLAAAQAARHEAVRIYGESLELRWAAERVWQSLASQLDHPQAVRRAARIRQQVARYFADQFGELQTREARLRQQQSTLEQLQQKLHQQRQQLERWFTSQRQELEADAARLIAARHQWCIERVDNFLRGGQHTDRVADAKAPSPV